MEMGGLMVVCDEGPKRFEAVFPALDVPDPPKYVRLRANGKSEVLRSSQRTGGKTHVFVSRSSTLPDKSPVSYEAATPNQYRWFVLWRDRDSKLALLGLAMAIAGVYIDASLGLGKIKPIWTFSETWIFGFSMLSYALKVPGIILAFLGVFLKQTSQA
jgi:hypothetical protein